MANDKQEVIGTLITIGDEILLGDIPNGNAHFIAYLLRCKGFRLASMITVGDAEEEIVEILRRYLVKSDFLIVTGGLGPTDDDRTDVAVAEAFQLPLVTNREYKQWLQKKLAERGHAWSPEVEKMTRLPEGSVKLGVDMAGFFLEQQGVPCYFLPGVPHEMRHLMQSAVIPDLGKRFAGRPMYLKQVLRVQELMESEIQQKLQGLSFQEDGIDVGYLPQVAENWVTLLVKAESEQTARDHLHQAEQEVIARLGCDHISGHNDETLEWVVGNLLRGKGWKMAAAESCTGGLLSHKITAIAGASDYFDRALITYSNQAKMDLLGVPEELLRVRGAVSAEVAEAMAAGARERAKVDIALAVTGIAGPSGGSPEKPVGTVFIACSTGAQTTVDKHLFHGDREQIQERSAQAALRLLWRTLCR